MALSYEKVINMNYNKKLEKERKSKGLYDTVYIPNHLESLRILPISNLFYGYASVDVPSRLKLLGEHISRINDMENGAFFLGGNLFYYPAGNTYEKDDESKMSVEALSTLLRKADKSKILCVFEGVNEMKFKNDRKLIYPIETTKILAQNLGIEDRYYDDTKVELDFVFNNELTEFKNQFMFGLFTSLRPISHTRNAILNKINDNFLLNGEKTFVIDTSSSQLIRKKKKLVVSDSPIASKAIDVTWLSVAGYTEHPQIIDKGNRYVVNQKVIELKIERRNHALGQQVKEKANVIKDDEWNRSLELLTIGVDYEKYFDPKTFEDLNKVLFHGTFIKNELLEAIAEKVDKKVKTEQGKLTKKLYMEKDNESKTDLNNKDKKEVEGFRFE